MGFSGTLQLTSYTGTVSKWQRSVDGGTQWTDIANTATSNGFTEISSTTKYCAVITNGGSCGTTLSSFGTVYVNQSAVGGTISAAAFTVRQGTNSTLLTLNNYVGAMRWQSSTMSESAGFANIDNAITNTFTSSNIPVTTYYRAVLSSGTCDPVNSTVFTLTTNAPISVQFTLIGDGCANSRTTLSSTNTFNSYTWFLNGAEISNINSRTFSPSAAGNYYVRVFNGTCYGTSSDITINTCGISRTGKLSATDYPSMINTLGGTANTANKGMDDRGLILNVPN